MKRFATAILAFLFLSTSMGMTLHMHYCMDELVAASLMHAHADKDACSNCGMKKKPGKNNCCKDEHAVIKTDVSLKAELNEFSVLAHLDLDAPVKFFEFPPALMPVFLGGLRPIKAPPDAGRLPLYLKNSVYRI